MSALQAENIGKPRILAVLDPYQDARHLLRSAKRKARLLGCDWEVLVIETPAVRRLSDAQKAQCLSQTTLAEEMGAIVTNIMAKNMLQGVIETVRLRESQQITIVSIKIGFQRIKKSFLGLAPPFSKQLRKAFGAKYPITYIPSKLADSKEYYWLRDLFKVNFKNILKSLLVVALATLTIEVIDHFWPQVMLDNRYHNKAIIYMAACAYAAGRYGLVPGIVAGVASFIAIGTIYFAPHGRMIVDNASDAASLGLFMVAAIIISLFGSREYGERESVMRKLNRLQSLMNMNYNTLNEETPMDAMKVLSEDISKMLGGEVTFFMPSALQPDQLQPLFKEQLDLGEADQRALEVCWQESKTTGVGTDNNHGCLWRFEPLQGASDDIGVLGIQLADAHIVDISYGKLLTGIAEQATLILERVELGYIAEESRVQAEREKLRAMLLSSVSHDLKTPLASVIGSLSVFRSMRHKLPVDKQESLINTALDEAQRLDSFITNILDMTRIESGQIELKQEWTSLGKLVKSVNGRLKDRLSQHSINIIPGGDIEVMIDEVMTGQVLQNLLDNAAKYTDPSTQIDVSWEIVNDRVNLAVRDYGLGIPASKIGKVFDKYERINHQDSQVAGTGLGLAIAKAVMSAQEGDIIAENHPNGGAIFTLTLPHWRIQEQPTKHVA